MKTYLFAFLIAFTSKSIAADFKSADEVIKKLSAYTMADITSDDARNERNRLKKNAKDEEKLKIDEVKDDIKLTVIYLQTHPVTEDLVFALERACLLTFMRDEQTESADFILKIYQKNVDLFKKASKKLYPYDAHVIIDVLDGKSGFDKDTEG
jgi:hypothetical protein